MNILYLTHLINGLSIFALAIGAGIWLTRRFGLPWRLYWIGAATFVLSQVGHIPFNIGLGLLFSRGLLPAPPTAWQLPFNAVVLGLSAGVFEECARYFVYRWWAKDARSWSKGLLFGAGHGGIEAMIVGALVLIAYVVMVAIRDTDLTRLVPAAQLGLAQQQIEAYWSLAWYDSLLGAVERAFAILAQIAMAVMVLQVFTRRQLRWLWLAIGWHALLDGVAVFANQTWGIYVTEGLVGVMALGSLGIIFALRQPEPPSPPTPEPSSAPDSDLLLKIAPPEETAENLEQTRFT